MTRKRALEMTREQYNVSHGVQVRVIINSIFDDFESRTCSVCEFYDSKGICKNTENDITYIGWETLPMPTQRNQLCHKFERKEDV